jgi:hypothetical protein
MDAKKLYLEIKRGPKPYKEEVHCPMILEVMKTAGTRAAFCKKAAISDGLFSKWTKKHKIFSECYQIGKMISKANWEEEGRKGESDEEFNLAYWKSVGVWRYSVGKGKIKMDVDSNSNPYDQYKQLIKQASQEEFSASEIKQLMESINVGIRAYESFELQSQVSAVKDDLEKMRVNSVNNSSTVKAT